MKVIKNFGLLAFSALCLLSCTEKEQEQGGIMRDITTMPVRISFSMTPMKGDETVTRSRGEKSFDLMLGEDVSSVSSKTATRASWGTLTDAQENAINDICIFQFDAKGDLLYREYTQLIENTDRADISLAMGVGDCIVYVLANVGNKAAEVAINMKEEDFKKLVGEVTTGKGSGENVPMSGKSTFDSEKDTSLSVDLTRAVAKVNLILTTPNAEDQFTPVCIKLMNVAKELYYVESNATEPENEKLTYYTSDNSKEITWYIPENKAGKTEGITNWKDRYEGKAPGTATYIQIEGRYKPANGTVKDVAYTIYLGSATDANDFNVERNTRYTVNATIKGTNLNDGRVLVGKDLSAAGKETANCYLAKDINTWYRFKATVRGNGAMTPAQISYTGADIPEGDLIEPNDAGLVWETRDGSKRTIDFVGYSKNGYIVFKTGTVTEGNAVIAAKQGSKTLWSWHIWKTAAFDRDGIITQEYTNRLITSGSYAALTSRTYRVMDRNLGAGVGEVERKDATLVPKTYGLYYQFGRKDPFPAAAKMEKGENVDIATVYNGNGAPISKKENQIICSDITRGYAAGDIKNQLAYAVENPQMFIRYAADGNPSSSNNWIYAAHVKLLPWEVSNKLWGGDVNDAATSSLPLDTKNNIVKTIYDPCPYGYHMPPQDIWTNFTTRTDSYNAFEAEQYNGKDKLNSENDRTLGFMNDLFPVFGRRFYTNGIGSGSMAFYPASGFRDGGSGAVSVGGNSGWWSASPYSAKYSFGGYMTISDVWVEPVESIGRANAYPVRCVRD